MFSLADYGAWASIVGLVVGIAALSVSIWVLRRVDGLTRRLILDLRVPSLIGPLRNAATSLKDAEFRGGNLSDDARADVRRVLASLYRLRTQLPEKLHSEIDGLQEIGNRILDDSESNLQELYTQMIIMSDILEEVVEERTSGGEKWIEQLPQG